MKYLMIIFILINVVFGLNWQNDFDKAELTAKKEMKPILLLFTRKTCPYCLKLDKEIKNGMLDSLKNNFIFIKISTLNKKLKKEITTKLNLKVKYVPTLFIVDFFQSQRTIKELKENNLIKEIHTYYTNMVKKVDKNIQPQILKIISKINLKD